MLNNETKICYIQNKDSNTRIRSQRAQDRAQSNVKNVAETTMLTTLSKCFSIVYFTLKYSELEK